MELTNAKSIATKLMSDHGLLTLGWHLEFDSSKKRFGYCAYGPKTISLSRELVALNSEARVTNTILHEIAHALLPPHVGHKLEWVRLARKIGCDGVRCYSSDTTTVPKMPFTGTCPHCARVTYKTRVPRRPLACRICCRAHGRGFNPRFQFVWTRTDYRAVQPVAPFVPPTFVPVSAGSLHSSIPTVTPTNEPLMGSPKPTRYALWKARKLARMAA